MKQNGKPRNKPMPCSQLILEKGGKNINRVKIVYSINDVGKIGHTYKKTRSPSYTIHKNKLKMD